MEASDPRVFFAAERTLLAWLRTGLTLMGLGFVVARFGLFLRLLALQSPLGIPTERLAASGVLGVLFIVVGAASILIATLQHQRYVASIPASDLPKPYSRSFAVILSGSVGVLGFMLAAYLAVSHG